MWAALLAARSLCARTYVLAHIVGLQWVSLSLLARALAARLLRASVLGPYVLAHTSGRVGSVAAGVELPGRVPRQVRQHRVWPHRHQHHHHHSI